jgi:hypothetical protein
MLAAQNPLLSQLGKCLNLIGSEFRSATARKQVFLGNDAQTGWKGTFRRRARHTLLAHNLANRQHYSEADCVPTVSRRQVKHFTAQQLAGEWNSQRDLRNRSATRRRQTPGLGQQLKSTCQRTAASMRSTICVA